MKICYIAHPISGNIDQNINEIIQIVRKINLARTDVVPFAPYMADILALDDNEPIERGRGISNDIAILKSGMVNELWVYGPRISAGMEKEIKLAYELGIPVFGMDEETAIPVHVLKYIKKGY